MIQGVGNAMGGAGRTASPDYKVIDFVAHSSDVTSLKLSQRNSPQLLATGASDGKINVWSHWESGRGPTNKWTMGNNKSSIESFCFSDEGQCLVSGAMSGSIKVFDLSAGKLTRSLRGHQVLCHLFYLLSPLFIFISSSSFFVLFPLSSILFTLSSPLLTLLTPHFLHFF